MHLTSIEKPGWPKCARKVNLAFRRQYFVAYLLQLELFIYSWTVVGSS